MFGQVAKASAIHTKIICKFMCFNKKDRIFECLVSKKNVSKEATPFQN